MMQYLVDLIERTSFLGADRVILRDHWRAHAVLPADRDHLRRSHRARRRRPVAPAAVGPGSQHRLRHGSQKIALATFSSSSATTNLSSVIGPLAHQVEVLQV